MDQGQAILLVDNSEDDLMLMRIAFQKAGFTCPLPEVHDGDEAIAYLKGEKPYDDRSQYPLPTIILLDANMPRKNGFEVLAWVRAQPAHQHLSMIMLSASMRNADVERAFKLGATSFIVKPSELNELVNLLRAFRAWLAYNHFPLLPEAGKS